MNDDKMTAHMLQNVLKSLKAKGAHQSVDAAVLDVLDRAESIVDPAIRGVIKKQCDELLGVPASTHRKSGEA